MEFEEKRMVYEGDFEAGIMSGRGKMIFSNGLIYDGDWDTDCFCGEGTLFLNDGRLIKGTWNSGSLVEGELFTAAAGGEYNVNQTVISPTTDSGARSTSGTGSVIFSQSTASQEELR